MLEFNCVLFYFILELEDNWVLLIMCIVYFELKIGNFEFFGFVFWYSCVCFVKR